MREPESRVIDGVEFKVTPLARKAQRTAFVKLTKIIAPAVAKAADGAKSVADLQAHMGKHLVSVIDSLASKVEVEDLDYFEGLFSKCTEYSEDGGEKWPHLRHEENRDAVFGGRLPLYFQWMKFCLEVNFSDFLEFAKPASPAAGSADPIVQSSKG